MIRQMPSTEEDTSMHNYNDNEMENTQIKDLANMMKTDRNIDYLTKLIIDRSSMNGVYDRVSIREQVIKYLTAWESMGKFDTFKYRFVNMIAAMDSYNKEFVNTFAATILPEDVTKVESVVNPNGMYAQQERILKTTSKPVPFYERTIFRRLTDKTLVQPISETQNLFYGMTNVKDPRYKVTYDREDVLPDYRQKQNESYRMVPKY